MYPSRTLSLEDWMADASTDSRLLPIQHQRSDNTRRRAFCKRAMQSAMDKRLTPAQRRRLEQHYLHGVSKSEIARREHSSCSAIGKSLHSAERSIREYAALYMEIYDDIERLLLNEF